MVVALDLRPSLELTDEQLEHICQRNPDAAWVTHERWESLTLKQRTGWIPLCPDFAVELRSPTDDLDDLRSKMREYMENGQRLGWLLDPEGGTVEVYRPGQAVEILQEQIRCEFSFTDGQMVVRAADVLEDPGVLLKRYGEATEQAAGARAKLKAALLDCLE